MRAFRGMFRNKVFCRSVSIVIQLYCSYTNFKTITVPQGVSRHVIRSCGRSCVWWLCMVRLCVSCGQARWLCGIFVVVVYSFFLYILRFGYGVLQYKGLYRGVHIFFIFVCSFSGLPFCGFVCVFIFCVFIIVNAHAAIYDAIRACVMVAVTL